MVATKDAASALHESNVSLRQIRDAIPKHCFQPSALRSTLHVISDVCLAAAIMILAHSHIPHIESRPIRYLLWAMYGYLEGLVFTGIWIIAHECGHGALFPTSTGNDSFGFVLHSFLLVPYFSWKYTHARHHRYTNHMEKDTVFVPAVDGHKTWTVRIRGWLGHAEDAPLVSLALLLTHQLFGFPVYLWTYISAGIDSEPNSAPVKSGKNPLWDKSHLNPAGSIFTDSERLPVALSTFGIALTLFGVYQLALAVGWENAMLLYGVPYLWVNNWLIAITYLHHTHPDVHHFDGTRWTYLDGALSTIDRPYGFVGKYLFHGIIDFHVVHHLFPRIPFYHAEEATKAIRPILGERYNRDETPFWVSLWRTFRGCQQVQRSGAQPGVLMWKST